MASIISESDLPYSFLAILQIRVSSFILTATGCLIWPDILILKHCWSELELYNYLWTVSHGVDPLVCLFYCNIVCTSVGISPMYAKFCII